MFQGRSSHLEAFYKNFCSVAFMHLSKPQEMPVRYLILVVYLLVYPAWNRLKDDKFDIEFPATVAAQK